MKTKSIFGVMTLCLFLLLLSCKEKEQSLFSASEVSLTSKTSESVVKEVLLPALPDVLQKLGDSEEAAKSVTVEESRVIHSDGYAYLLVSYSNAKGEFGEVLMKYVDPSNIKQTSFTLKSGQTIFLTTDLKAYRCYGDCGCRVSVNGQTVDCGCQQSVGGCTLEVAE